MVREFNGNQWGTKIEDNCLFEDELQQRNYKVGNKTEVLFAIKSIIKTTDIAQVNPSYLSNPKKSHSAHYYRIVVTYPIKR